ncbi:MAG: GntR family transcriptional regulator, partial [Burkholderiales bacterium]
SVREAIQQLHAQGLVSVAANRGASVRRLSKSEVTDLFVVRERLEGLGAFLAAQHVKRATASKPALGRLQALVGRMGKVAASQDALVYGKLNRELHRTLLDLSQNPELVRLVHRLSLPIFQQQFRGFLQPDNQRTSHAQHEAIIAAVLDGDSRAAETAMRRHVRDGLRMVLQWPDENFAPE